MDYEETKEAKRKIFTEEGVETTIAEAVEELRRNKMSEHKKRTPFEIFCDYNQLSCDWHVDPENWEAWNGAVKAVADYVVNMVLLDYDESMPVETFEAYKQKILDKFLEK